MAKKVEEIVKSGANSKVTKKKSKKISVSSGCLYVQSTFNNTIITLTDEKGNLLGQGSPAVMGYKGAKRSTAYAATQAAKDVAIKVAKTYGLKDVKAFISGPGAGRNAAIKGVDSAGIRITSLVDRTPVPHNGCRPRKTPRN